MPGIEFTLYLVFPFCFEYFILYWNNWVTFLRTKDIMEEIDSTHHFSKTVKYSVGILISVCIFSLTWLFLQDGNFSSSFIQESREDGLIHFSARTNEPGHFSSVFVLDVANREIFPIKATKPNAITNTDNVSPDNNRLVYSEAILEVENGQAYIPSTSQLAVFDARDNVTRTVTNSNTYKTTPEWSSSGTSIVIASIDLIKNTSVISSESWDVMITDLSGSETFITNGFHPQWFPDGVHLLVLKNDGPYIFNKDTKNGRKLSGIEEIVMSSDMKMDLSRDGSRIAISTPDSEKVFIIRVLSLESYLGEVEHEIPGPAFWPVFSEDGDSIALYEADLNSVDTDPRPRITIYNLETSEREVIYDLSAFDPESIAITDWRK